jgi:hypothetical protein
MKSCLECEEKIIGEDKKFCSDGRRNAYTTKKSIKISTYAQR